MALKSTLKMRLVFIYKAKYNRRSAIDRGYDIRCSYCGVVKKGITIIQNELIPLENTIVYDFPHIPFVKEYDHYKAYDEARLMSCLGLN